ncbi:uncharacterized protein PSFLO_04933 [Pseudozyma flocculosa]|nr:uncharacterized protein PSFLO_04933 [Pseudozyma flocculosa]
MFEPAATLRSHPSYAEAQLQQQQAPPGPFGSFCHSTNLHLAGAFGEDTPATSTRFQHTPQQTRSASPSQWSPAYTSPTFSAVATERGSLGSAFAYQTPSMREQALPADNALDSVGSYRSSLHQASPTFHRSAASVTARPLEISPRSVVGPSAEGGREIGMQAVPLAPSFGSLGSAAMQSSQQEREGEMRFEAVPLMPLPPTTRRPVSASSLLAATARVSLQSPQVSISSLDAANMVPSSAGSTRSSYSWLGNLSSVELQPTPSDAAAVADPTTGGDSALARELGLGLDLMPEERDHEMIEHLAPEAPVQPMDDDDVAMHVDEMGRLTFGMTQRRGSTTSVSTGSLGFDSASSRPRHGLWHQSDASWITGDGSWLASTGPSSVDNSFQEDSIGSAAGKAIRNRLSLQQAPVSRSAARRSTSRPTSSSGVTAAVMLSRPPSSDARPSDTAQRPTTGDFSEFGQSVPIESMADERWRTWLRGRDASDRSASGTAQSPPNSAAVEPAPPSATPGRARLMVEPYSKASSRNARPSSATSTSSRSSTGGIGTVDLASTPSSAGPTRPRSTLMATGASVPSRSTSTSRSSFSSGADRVQERKASSVSALRRARGLSQSGLSSLSSSRIMELSRSSDSMEPRRANMAAMQRVTSLDTGKAGALGTSQRNWSRPMSHLQTEDSASASATPPVDVDEDPAPAASSTSPPKVGFNEVSVALDTLRIFLHQKSAVNRPSSRETSQTSDSTPSDHSSGGTIGVPQRTLRRAKGTLPPRGSVTISDDVEASLAKPGGSGVGESKAKAAKGVGHGRVQSMGALPLAGSSREQDRLAVLQDLSERIRRLKEASESGRHPPSARPNAVGQSTAHPAAAAASSSSSPAAHSPRRAQPSPADQSRRQMHEEFLAARARQR